MNHQRAYGPGDFSASVNGCPAHLAYRTYNGHDVMPREPIPFNAFNEIGLGNSKARGWRSTLRTAGATTYLVSGSPHLSRWDSNDNTQVFLLFVLSLLLTDWIARMPLPSLPRMPPVVNGSVHLQGTLWHPVYLTTPVCDWDMPIPIKVLVCIKCAHQ